MTVALRTAELQALVVRQPGFGLGARDRKELEASMRFLLLATNYPTQPGGSYLSSELAEALVAAGHSVEVALLDWGEPPNGPTEQIVHNGIKVLRVMPRAWTRFGTTLLRMSKFALSGRHAAAEAKHRIDFASFDACIAWMPAVPLAQLIAAAKRAGVPNRILFIWDFFPIHHREIGLIPPGPIFRIAKRLEERAMADCTAFLPMMPSNVQYLRDNYRIADQSVGWTPIWADTSPPIVEDRTQTRQRYGLPLDRPIAIFGGQITQGRGIELILGAAREIEAVSDILFVFVGSGRLAEQVRLAAASATNVKHFEAVPRQDYLSLLAAADIGLVATVAGVSSHTFPSKTMDYLRLGIPIVAAVEPGNDYEDIIDQYKLGVHTRLNAKDFGTAVAGILQNDEIRQGLKDRSYACLTEMFAVERGVKAIEAII